MHLPWLGCRRTGPRANLPRALLFASAWIDLWFLIVRLDISRVLSRLSWETLKVFSKLQKYKNWPGHLARGRSGWLSRVLGSRQGPQDAVLGCEKGDAWAPGV